MINDQFDRNQKRITEIIETNDELKKLLGEIVPLKERLLKLDEEVANDPNVELLLEIMDSTKHDAQSIIEIRPSLFGMTIDLKQLVRTITKVMSS